MESVPQLVSAVLDKVAPDPLIKGSEKCIKKLGELGSFPALNDVVTGVPESLGACCDTESEWIDTENSASACSLESGGSSNAISGNSLVSDADSLAHSFEPKNVKKCPSGGSIVTYDEAVSKLNEAGECKASDQRVRRGKRVHVDTQLDEQETSANTAPGVGKSAGKAWTDDKHCSYLNSIEATFVRSLYEKDYPNVDLSEQDQDCVESRPMDPGYLTYHAGGELFTSLQRGCYDQREYYRPHYIFAPAPAVFASPWIQHFNPKIAPQGLVAGGVQDVLPGQTSSPGFVDGIHSSSYMYQGVVEEVMESVPVMHDPSHVPHGWNSRHHSQFHASTSAPVRPDANVQGKKRACDLDLDFCADALFRPKKFKSTQQRLAETDLELEEQFVLEQLNQREDAYRLDNRESGRRLDVRSNLLRCTSEGEGHEITPEMLPKNTEAEGKRIEGEPSLEKKVSVDLVESTEDRERRELSCTRHDREVPVGRLADSDRGKKYLDNNENAQDNPWRAGAAESSQHNAGRYEGCSEPENEYAAYRLKVAVDDNGIKSQQDTRYDEDDECKFVTKKSPRACRTYTWGLKGTRRPLLPGNLRETKENGLTVVKEQL
ncbi:hypothetical protein R1sor_012823 [Riccia sorocarpa]|uniref:Uncharacterized protein n=1 Tax=Riccia sorocarpa TaxID=122646 RepID=A0ABD3I4U2_9MARC